MRRLHILMPMAGFGSRFRDKGWTVPKPLIPVDGMPMFLKALSSFKTFQSPYALTAIIRASSELENDLPRTIETARPDAKVVKILKPTRGAVETCLAAKEFLQNTDSVLVLDCDIWFSSPAFLRTLEECLHHKNTLDGLVLTFPSNSPRYSYATLDKKKVIKTAEKDPTSRQAMIGAYFFTKSSAFLDAALGLVSQPPINEYYVSHLYNRLIDNGANIEAIPVSSFASFGTPEELSDYERSAQSSSRLVNPS